MRAWTVHRGLVRRLYWCAISLRPMENYFRIILLLSCWFSTAQAATVRQHSATGVVSLVDSKTNRVFILPEGEPGPLEIDIIPGRTKLRCDGRAAVISELSKGQIVQIFFRPEARKNVAIQIRWQTGKSK